MGRVKGFSRLTRVRSKAQARYGHAITHSSRYLKAKAKQIAKKQGIGIREATKKARKIVQREHDFLVRHHMSGLKGHKTPKV